MKIAIVSLYTQEIEDLVIHTSSNHRKYAEINGYDYILFKGRFSNRFPAWDKIKSVEKVLHSYDYVLWLDSDCIFNKLNYRIENILNSSCKGYFGKDPVDSIYINSGVFLLQNHKWSFDLLEYVWGKPGKYYETIDKFSYQDWPFEQGPICEFLQKDNGNHCIVPEYMLNCHPSFVNDRTFIIHYMGCRTNNQTYNDTLSKIKLSNQKNNILPKLENFIELNGVKSDEDIIILKNKFDVKYNGIEGFIDFYINKNNSLCFNYTLPKNKHLSHIFKINNQDIKFNSDSFGCFEVPNEFDLYHSYEWYGKTDFKYIGHFKIND